MPVDKQKLLRYYVLNKCFRDSAHRYTIDDLLDECNRRVCAKLDMPPVSKRTIQNDIKELEQDPYNIVLDESLRDGHKRIYRYQDTDFSINPYNISDEERNRIQGAIEVLKRFEQIPQYDWVRLCLQRIANNQFATDNRMVVSFQNNPGLCGIELFERLLKAVFNKQPLQMVYQPYDRFRDGKVIHREQMKLRVFPYHLKQFNNRWFLFAKAKENGMLYNFAIDRIQSVKPIRIKFQESGLDFDEFFDDTVVVTVKQHTETVLLKVHKHRYQYIKTKPLHNSQTEILSLETPTHVVLSLKVDINNELESLILSYGDDVEVLEPQLFRSRVASKIRHLSKIYKE